MNVYPNPIRQQATIEYEIPESGNVLMRLLNSNGQVVTSLHNGFRVKGVYRLPVSQLQGLTKLPGGTYFLQMEFGQRKLVQKLIIDF